MGNNESAPPLEQTEDEVDLEDQNLSMIPYNIPSNHPLKVLLLAHNRLELLPPFLENLVQLDVSYNELHKLDLDKIILDFPKLKNLMISGNQLHKIPNIIHSFTNLTDISADRNKLTDDSNSFKDFTKLENVDLFLNMYTEIPTMPDSLISLNMGFNYIREVNLSLPNLRELRLPGNNIKMISSDCFFPSLTVLELTMNNLDELPPIKAIAPKLEKLNVSFNYLQAFPADFPVTIQKIDMSNNVINKWEESMEHLTNLKTLDVSHNHIPVVPKLPVQLQDFNAESNEISEVESFSTESIQSIQLNNNKFTTIPHLKDCGATSLTIAHNMLTEIDLTKIGGKINKLDFTDNLIKQIPLEVFLLDKLQTLNLTANGITKLPDGIKSSKLTSLYINENQISELPELPISLITLDAIKCLFTELPPQLMSLTRLASINFANNKIEKIGQFPQARHISLSCNKITEVAEVPESVTFLDLAHNEIKELTIGGDFSMLQELDVSHNKIEKLAFDSLPVIGTFKISHNPLTNFTLNLSKLPALKICDISATSMQKLPEKIPTTIREFATSDENLFKKIKTQNIRLFQSTRCGYSEACGSRPSMEDALILRENVEPNLNIYAVIDGHGGTETAALSAYFIPHYFAEEKTKSIASFSSVVKRLIERLKKSSAHDGATIAFTIVTPTEIGCAYLGDTRALIVSKSGKVSPLSFDHKPTAPTEIALIRENCSFVSDKRTAGILAISRALGDFKVGGVVHIPDMTSRVIKEDDHRLVIACDGVFDVLTQEEVGKIVTEEPDVNKAAALVRNIALSRLTQDNVSVIVVDISKPWK